jgi:uncharacterized protein (DUF58 family)
MTRRGFWFLAVAGGGLVISIALPSQFSVTLLTLTALLWYGVTWTMLRWQRDLVIRKLRVARWIDGTKIDPAGSPATLWEDRPVVVWIKLEGASERKLPRIKVIDRLPTRALVRGSHFAVGTSSSDDPITIGYELRPRFPGRIRFEGVEIEITDTAGFFRMQAFLRGGEQGIVYPRLVGDPRSLLAEKQEHLILAAGTHRHRRPGSGTELLGLRDYIPGDPPKRIAWRISARRDAWTTKEFESDVPIRSTIFLDHSSAVRVGWPGPTPLVDATRLAAALTRYWIEKRDPVGLVLVDDDEATILSPAVGPRHEARLLRSLCDIAASPPKPSPCPVPSLLESAKKACQQLYPELLDPDIHRRYSPRDHWRGTFSKLAFPASLIALSLLGYSRFLSAESFQWMLGTGLVIAAIVLAAMGMFWIYQRIRSKKASLGFKGTRARQEIATVVATVNHLGPTGIPAMMEHDATFSREVQQFLVDHDSPYPRPLHDEAGRYVYASTGKIEHLSRACLRAISHAKDNELLLFMVDLLEIDSIAPFLSAIKVARSRHHEVIVAIPWPAELDEPASTSDPPTLDEPTSIPNDLIDHYFRAYRNLEQSLRRLGVPLLTARPGRSAAAILQRVESLRAARIHTHR